MGPPVYSKCLWAEDFGPKRSLLERLFTHYEQYNNNKTSSQPSSSSQPCSSSQPSAPNQPSSSQPGSSSQPSSSLEYNSTFLQTPYVVLLTENYRCHAKILEFPSDCFYGGELVPEGDQSTHDSVPVLSFYTAQGMDNRDDASLAYYNDAEVAEVVKRVEELIELWPKDWSKNIGVLTPYRDQVFTYTNCTDCLINHSTMIAQL